mgnify:CR=1 FL=1
MAVKYDSTLLATINDPLEIQKADLDLLKKINEQAGLLETQTIKLSTGFNTESEEIKNIDDLSDSRFFTFNSEAIGAPITGSQYTNARGISFTSGDNRTQIANITKSGGILWRTRENEVWSRWRTLIDNINVSSIYRNDFLLTASGNVTDGFITTVVASGTVAQGAVADDHPGSVRITSSTTTNSGAYVATQANALTIKNVKQYSAIYSPLSFVATVTTRLGIHNTLTATAPTLGVYWEAVGASCTAKVVGTYGTYTSNTVTLSTGVWYQFSIKILGSTAYFDLYLDDGTLVASFSTGITLNSTANNACFISTKAGTAKTALVDLDLVKLNMLGENPRYV